MAYIDFKEVKARVDITTVAKLLKLKMSQNGGSQKADCPMCNAPRAISISPEQNTFYCWASKEGGDQLSLVAHVIGINTYGAALWITSRLTHGDEEEKPQEKGALLPLNHLDFDHEALHKMGLPKEWATAVGIGYAKKGVLRGHVAIPIRDPKGTLLMYIGWNPKDGSWKLGGET